MSTTDNVYIKKHAIVDLQAPVAAANIDDNFDAIFAALQELQTKANAGTAHALLDGDQNNDTVAAAPSVGAIIIGSAAALWTRLIAGANTAVLRLVASLPTWVVLTSLDFLHTLLSATHTDTAAAGVVQGDLIRGEAITTGLTDTTKFWSDGATYAGLSGTADPSGGQFWSDGAVDKALVSGAVVSATLWRRVPAGNQGQVMTMNLGLPTWRDSTTLTGLCAHAYATAVQSLPWNAPTALTFAATEFDTSSFWSAGAPTRLTVASSGIYIVIGQVGFSPFVGPRLVLIYVNGVVRGQQEIGELGADSLAHYDSDPHQCSRLLSLSAGDYIELYANQLKTTGAAVNTVAGAAYTFLSAVKVG